MKVPDQDQPSTIIAIYAIWWVCIEFLTSSKTRHIIVGWVELSNDLGFPWPPTTTGKRRKTRKALGVYFNPSTVDVVTLPYSSCWRRRISSKRNQSFVDIASIVSLWITRKESETWTKHLKILLRPTIQTTRNQPTLSFSVCTGTNGLAVLVHVTNATSCIE